MFVAIHLPINPKTSVFIEQESPGSDGEMSAEETTDERATLLDVEGGTVSLQSMRFNKRKPIL